MAEFPHRVQKCLVTQEFSPSGRYQARLFIGGKEQIITIDDFFAINKQTGAWQFSYSSESEIWVQILEKAWAKACGTYAKTIGGLPSEALKALTGAPCETVNHKYADVDDFWAKVYDAD